MTSNTNDDERDPALQALFAGADRDLHGDNFEDQVMIQTTEPRRRKLARRAGLALLAAGAVVALQGVALHTSQLLLTSLIEIEHALTAELLAPINSVGGLLTAALLLLRSAYKRLFS